MVVIVSLIDRSGEERRMGGEGLMLDSSLTTVRLPEDTISCSGPWPGSLGGSGEEKVGDTTAVETEEFVLMRRGEIGKPSQMIHARGLLYT